MTLASITFWWSIVVTVLGVILAGISIWQATITSREKKRHKDQVKIWMQAASGIDNALHRVVKDNLDGRYSSTNDLANTIWSLQAASFALYQSLYDERVVDEEEFVKEQKKMRDQIMSQSQASSSVATDNSDGKELVKGRTEPSS